MRTVMLGDRQVAMHKAPFVVAEAGINHNGELSMAMELADVAKKTGADAIKFAMFKTEEFVGDPELQYTYISQGKTVSESMMEMFKHVEFTREEWHELSEYCKEIGISFFATAQNKPDLDYLLELGVDMIKVGSDDLTHTPMLKTFAESGKPIICSSGMADLSDVNTALEALGAFDGYPVVLLLCTSQYPTPSEQVNLRKMQTLTGAFPGIAIGFSDHTEGSLAAPLAVAFGACYLEKHFTLSHDLPGPDHRFSADPSEFKEWVLAIRKAQIMLGSPLVRPTKEEKEYSILARRSIVALTNIAPGESLTEENIGLRRPGSGLPPSLFNLFLGRTAAKAVRKGDLLTIEAIG